jgi:hypothetical protein
MAASQLGYTPGSGANVATDLDAGAHHQKALVEHLSGGVPTPASQTNPMPTALYGEAIEALEAMRMAIQALTRTMGQMQPDTAARMRVALDAISGGLTLATITTVGTLTTLATLTNQTQIGGLPATEQIPSLMRLGADSLRRNIVVS